MVSANGTVINDNVPSPKRDSVPLRWLVQRSWYSYVYSKSNLFDLKLLLFNALAVGGICTFGCVAHFDVRHPVCRALERFIGSFFVERRKTEGDSSMELAGKLEIAAETVASFQRSAFTMMLPGGMEGNPLGNRTLMEKSPKAL